MHGEGSHRRADIDGLRAVAVVSVLAYHAFPTVLSGGFMGVDVFFVISGYLISGILFAEISAGSFSLGGFYARRIRRIQPALITVLAAVTIVGFLTLYADEWKELVRQILAGCLFYSNFLFWSEAGYFDGASESKPLLHLWSLGVEEQFYLLWPALLWLVRGRLRWGILLSLTVGASLASSLWLRYTNSDGSFYSPLARFWELGIGALYAWLQCGSRQQLTAREHDAVSVLGIIMIVAGVCAIDRNTAFPGPLSLLPTLGAAAVIAAGPHACLNRYLLSHPLAVAIGAISYPLYLWHWPLLSFARIILGDEPTVLCRLALLAAAVALATLTYLGLEQPLRNRVAIAQTVRGCVVALLCVGAAVLVGTGPAVVHARTIHGRGDGSANWERNRQLLTWFDHDEACLDALDLRNEAAVAKTALFCSMGEGSGPIRVVIFGDSMANALFPGLSKLYGASGERVLNVGNGTCAPFRGLKGSFEWNKPCTAVNRKVYDYILAHPDIRLVILGLAPWDVSNMQIANLGRDAKIAERFAALGPLVAADVADLRKAGKQVVVTFDTPRIQFDPRICMTRPSLCIIAPAVIERGMEPYRTRWHELFAAIPAVCEFQQDAAFRLPDGNYTVARDGLILFRDDHHLSYLGSDVVANQFRSSPCF